MTDERGRPIISIETVAWSRSYGHHGEETKCVSLNTQAAMALSFCAIRFIEAIGENLANRLEVIKVRPQMLSFFEPQINTVDVTTIFGNFYSQKKLECYVTLGLPSFEEEKGSIDEFSSEFTRSLMVRLKDHIGELAESFANAKTSCDRMLQTISVHATK